MEQVTGAGVASIVVLGYVLLVEAVTAAILLLGQFIVVQVRALRLMLSVEWTQPRAPESVLPELPPDHKVVIGGGIRKWE